MVDSERHTVNFDHRAAGCFSHISGLGELGDIGHPELSPQHSGRIGGDRGHWVTQEVPVGRMDPYRNVIKRGNFTGGPHVVEMAVGDEDGRWLHIVLADHGLDPVDSFHPRVDDDAFSARVSGHEIAIGLQWSGRKRRNEHVAQVTRGAWVDSNPLAPRLVPMSAEAAKPWGRVDDQGNVYVRTNDGERVIAQWMDGDPDKALAFYAERFAGLETEVRLLEQRLKGGTLSPDDAAKAVDRTRENLVDAQAIGDLDTLQRRLDALAPAIDAKRQERKAERAAKAEEAVKVKERIAGEAEKIAVGADWRNGADKLRAMLDEWKTLPRIERKTDDALWHRFSSARTTYTRRRKTHFSEQAEKRAAAEVTKKKLIKEAEAMSSSTEWGPTAGKYRELMTRWKQAGPAPRAVDDRLWKQFRGAQDTFFEARDAANAALDAEYQRNAEKKLAVLEDAEKLLPITDVDQARKTWHEIADRWEEAGKVPRAKVKEFEARIRKVEDAIRAAGDKKWEQSNPEVQARANETVTKLEKSIDELRVQREKTADNAKKAAELDASIAARQEWLAQAQKAAADYS